MYADVIDKAFEIMSRERFVPEYAQQMARVDTPVPIGFGQTNSQPSTVQLMLEWLEVEEGNKILDVGSGSGWTTALLSKLVGPKGYVYGVEIVPALVRFGQNNLAKFDIKNARIFQAGKKYGLPRHAPYDRILVSAAAKEFPRDLWEQLKSGGRMVIPLRNDILVMNKGKTGMTEVKVHPGFVFVPLVPMD